MQLVYQQIKNLPVYTKKGDYLGKIKELEINSETQHVSKYIVESSQIVKRIVEKKLVISSSQVISLDDKKMVVEDLVITEKEGELVKEPATL